MADFETTMKTEGVISAVVNLLEWYGKKVTKNTDGTATVRMADGTLVVFYDASGLSTSRLGFYPFNDDEVGHLARGLEQIYEASCLLASESCTWKELQEAAEEGFILGEEIV